MPLYLRGASGARVICPRFLVRISTVEQVHMLYSILENVEGLKGGLREQYKVLNMGKARNDSEPLSQASSIPTKIA